jgi:hypothetical protein
MWDIGSLLLMLAAVYGVRPMRYDQLFSQSLEGIWAPQAVPITGLSLEEVVARPRSDASDWWS